MMCSMRCRLALLFGFLTCAATPALAQQAPRVMLSPIEVAPGVTFDGVFQDVNAAPHCVALSFPCTHERASKVSGVGVDVSIAANLTSQLALAGDVGTFTTGWDAPAVLQANRQSTRVTSLAGGARVSTGFFDDGSGDRIPGRFFGQVLVGLETSGVVPVRPMVLVGAGSDVLIPSGRRGVGVHLGIDYRVTPGSGRNFSGWRFILGTVFGPRIAR